MDISILRYLDVLIGFAVVMALASSFVTLLTQFMLQLNDKRADFLKQGIASLLKRSDPSLTTQEADKITEAVLKWQPASGKAGEMRDVIMREQLVGILLEIVTDPSHPNTLPRDKLLKVLFPGVDQNEITDYAKSLLNRIDSKACHLEAHNPKLATHVVHTQSIIEARAGKFIEAIMMRFDSMSESLTALYTTYSHQWTFGVSLIVALILPLDTIDLLQRLSSDDKLRAELVSKASEITTDASKPAEPEAKKKADDPGAKDANSGKSKTINEAKNSGKSEPSAPNQASKEADAEASVTEQAAKDAGTPAPVTKKPVSVEEIKTIYKALNDPKLNLSPSGWWPKIWQEGDWVKILQTVLGCILSALLMSIGAPFWFEALKNLLKLRPSLAKTDDEAREQRRKDETTSQTQSGGTPTKT